MLPAKDEDHLREHAEERPAGVSATETIGDQAQRSEHDDESRAGAVMRDGFHEELRLEDDDFDLIVSI